MSEAKNEQTVIEKTDTTAKPVVEGADARTDDLDALLAQYDKEVTPKSEAKPDTKAGTDTTDVRKDIESLRSEIAQRDFKADMAATVNDIRGELPADVFDDKLVQAWLDAQAQDDPRLQRAWLDRHDNPRQFQRVKQELGRKFSAKFAKLPDRQTTEDVAAVTAAVRGASSNKAPEGKAPDYSRMSNAEYRQAVIDQHGFDPGV